MENKKIIKKHPNFIDITGKIFGNLTVIEYAGNDDNKKAKWLCLCKCGDKAIIGGYNLRNNHAKSCGCLKSKLVYENREELLKRQLYARFIKNSRQRNLISNIYFENFKLLIFKPCYYCGIEYSCTKQDIGRNRKNHSNKKIFYNGLDRIDSSKGYIIDNVVPCCKYCNQAKSNLSEEEFKNLIKRIYKNYVNI